jgi:hypothetical protein
MSALIHLQIFQKVHAIGDVPALTIELPETGHGKGAEDDIAA